MKSPKDILKTYWGYDEFRPLQHEIIQSILDGKDTLALLPTGGGKSICFQVPALAKKGICLVVSPLIALMEDQVSQLRKRKISAAAIHSGINKNQIDRILSNAVHGDLKFLYLAPERLKSDMFLERLKQMNICLVAIDECHCISQWGHDFRSAYLDIHLIREWIPKTPFIALTATATSLVIEDIKTFLKLEDCVLFSKSFRRENIRFIVRRTIDKRSKTLEILQKVGGSAIVYADTRKHTKDYADLLNQFGITARYYHAGLDTEMKAKIQEDWISGKVRVMCATNAFGMGIDKPDVRLVIHPHVPSNPEGFYQEAGRAGRDGKPSISVLIYSPDDIENLSKHIELKYPEPPFLKALYNKVFQNFKIAFGTGEGFSSDFDIKGFCVKHQLDITSVYYGMKILEKCGYLLVNDFGRDRSRFMFNISHTELYKFQVANENLDSLITILLRSYGGLFEHQVEIEEHKIARRLNLTSEAVSAKLKNLNERGVASYQSKSKVPSITFLKSRVQDAYITIPKSIYDIRKKSDENRIAIMKDYAQKQLCREKVLLTYFGESESAPCGHCDACTELNKLELTEKIFAEIQTAILILLKTKPLPANRIPEQLPKFNSKMVSSVMRWMLDNSELNLNRNEFIEPK